MRRAQNNLLECPGTQPARSGVVYDATSARLRQPADVATLKCIQIGTEWFSERAGGLQRYFAGLLAHLKSAGVEAKGMVAGTARVSFDSEGAAVAFSPIDAPLLMRWRGARRHFRALEGEVVVSHSPVYTFALLSLLGDRPLVSHFHGPWAAESGRGRFSAKGVIERLVHRRARRCIVLSRAFARVLEESCGIAGDRIRVIPGGVEVERFESLPARRDARARLGWPLDRPIVLTVRRLVERVGLQDLVKAAVAVRRRIPEALILIAGQGPMQGTLSTMIEALGVGANVRLLGHVDDEMLPQAYRGADLTILPSTALEGFGLSAAESLAAGTPVLVTPVGGAPEVVEGLCPELVMGGVGTGHVSEALIEALTGRLALPSSAACAEFAARRFDWRGIAAKVADVYRETLR